MKHLILISLTVILFLSCTENTPTKEREVKPDPRGAINITIKTAHAGNVDLLKVEKTIHDEKGAVVRTILSVDTIPQLSLVRDTLSTGTNLKDATKIEKDTVIIHPKDYVFYISVKKE